MVALKKKGHSVGRGTRHHITHTHTNRAEREREQKTGQSYRVSRSASLVAVNTMSCFPRHIAGQTALQQHDARRIYRMHPHALSARQYTSAQRSLYILPPSLVTQGIRGFFCNLVPRRRDGQNVLASSRPPPMRYTLRLLLLLYTYSRQQDGGHALSSGASTPCRHTFPKFPRSTLGFGTHFSQSRERERRAVCIAHTRSQVPPQDIQGPGGGGGRCGLVHWPLATSSQASRPLRFWLVCIRRVYMARCAVRVQKAKAP